MSFTVQNTSGSTGSSEFLVNTEKGYMGMDKEMLERFSNIELPDSEAMKVHYRITATNGKTYYFVEINGEKQVVNRLPVDGLETDETNLSVKKFNQNFTATGNNRNVGGSDFNSEEYKGVSADTGNEVRVFLADQNSINIDPASTPKTAGVFGLGYIRHQNKTQLVTRVENDKGTAELQRLENINVLFNGSNYQKRENLIREEEHQNASVKEDVLQKKREYVENMNSSNRALQNKDLQILEQEEQMEEKRKLAMNKYIEAGAPAESNAVFALESLDPKDMVKAQQLECEKKILEINKYLSRNSPNSPDYSRQQARKNCLEEKIVAYKNAELEMDAIKERNADDTHQGNQEKMTYFFTEVSQNIMAKSCNE